MLRYTDPRCAASILARMDLGVTARAGIVTAFVVGLLACAVPTPAVADAPGRAFFGMQAWTLPNARDVAMMKRGGVGIVRAVFDGGTCLRSANRGGHRTTR